MTRPILLVIGAGVAGLTAARDLIARGHSVTVLEARNRIGGRALSIPTGRGAVDLGPAWIWPSAQPNICDMLDQLGLERIPQFEDGTFVYETAKGIQRGNVPNRYGDAARIRGGVGALVHAMAAALPPGTIRLDQPVSALDLTSKPQITTATEDHWTADIVISTAPLPIVSEWNVTPAWTANLQSAMTRWPTWMAAHAKVVAIYDNPFWRESGLSGSAVSQVGPLVEIADQSDSQLDQFALFGFVGWPYQNRQDRKALHDEALAQLSRLFGPQAAHPKDLHIMDWATEPFTATKADRMPPMGHPPYGAPELSQHIQDRLLFAGAEVAQTHGGLIEGAVETGLKAARKATDLLG